MLFETQHTDSYNSIAVINLGWDRESGGAHVRTEPRVHAARRDARLEVIRIRATHACTHVARTHMHLHITHTYTYDCAYTRTGRVCREREQNVGQTHTPFIRAGCVYSRTPESQGDPRCHFLFRSGYDKSHLHLLCNSNVFSME